MKKEINIWILIGIVIIVGMFFVYKGGTEMFATYFFGDQTPIYVTFIGNEEKTSHIEVPRFSTITFMSLTVWQTSPAVTNTWVEVGTPDGSYEVSCPGQLVDYNSDYSCRSTSLKTYLNSALNNGACDCTGCSINVNLCSVPLTFHSDTAGILRYSSTVYLDSTATNDHAICYDGDSWWVNANEELEEKKENCQGGCDGGVCTQVQNTLADTNFNGNVDRTELGAFMTLWTSGSATRDDLGLAIVAWASGSQL